MADIAQILLLPPPPVRNPATGRAVAPQGHASGQGQGHEDGSPQAGSSDQAQARRFRFRVYESGESSQSGTELDTRRAGGNAAVTASQINLGNSGSRESQSGQGGREASHNAGFFNRASTAASSAFAAQSIAQEQLGEGLYNPPYAAAAAAYTRTGGALDARPSAGLDISA